MNAIFIESSEFTEWISEYLGDEGVVALQRELLNDPDVGDIIPGCGGLRKMRVGDPRRGKGKRGGVRVIYLHVPEAHVIFLMDIYGKGEKEDLTAGQKKLLKALADQFKREVTQQTKRGKSL